MQRAGATLLTPPRIEYACTVMSSDSSADAAPTPTTAGSGTADDAADRRDDLVDAVRRYRDAERSMRSRSRDSMHLGKTDMTALRLMLRAGRGGPPLSAAALARELSISTAATTVLVDRLEKGGHAERRRSATDGRAIEIWPTAAADAEIRSTMGLMHERMMMIASSLSPEESGVIQYFLRALGQAMSDLELPAAAAAVRLT